jgi:hypothetical protein
MDTDLVSALVSAQAGRLQLAVAAQMLRMSADSASSVAELVDAAQQNLDPLAYVAAGIGANLDVSA